MTYVKAQKLLSGMSLVECLVSVAISLIVMATLMSLLLHNAQIANAGIKQKAAATEHSQC